MFLDEDKHIVSIGADENHEFTKFTEAVDFGVCRDLP